MSLVTFVTLLFFVGATGKSAQIPLLRVVARRDGGSDAGQRADPCRDDGDRRHLHDRAAEFPLRDGAGDAAVVAVVGAVTALFAATVGVDAERHQEGAGVLDGQPARLHVRGGWASARTSAGVFHLMTHAFFKACLFLGAGSVIHAMGGEQDMRKMGGLRQALPITFWTFLAATLAHLPASRRSPASCPRTRSSGAPSRMAIR